MLPDEARVLYPILLGFCLFVLFLVLGPVIIAAAIIWLVSSVLITFFKYRAYLKTVDESGEVGTQ